MRSKVLILLVAIFSFSLTATAQTSRGTVSGTVTDPAGAVVSGANITLTNTSTGLSRTTNTNEEGLYRFEAVDLGTYTVAIEATGFGALTKTNVIVNANQTSAVDAQITPGGQQVTIDVIADAGAALQTEAPVRGGNISQRQITELPTGSRNPVGLALTLPGVTTNRTGVGISTFVVNGARGRSNNFLIDGVENNDISVAGQGFEINNPDAVQEVSVQTSNYDAEFGRAGGGVVNVITRSGENEFHGTLSTVLDSSRDDAITSSQARNAAVIQRGYPLFFMDNIYSATLGGPLHLPRFGEGGPAITNGKDRTFFFTAFQFQRQRSNASVNLVTPTAAGRATLRSLFAPGANANVDFLLNTTAETVGTANPLQLALGVAPGASGTSSTACTQAALNAGNRPCVEFATFVRNYASVYDEYEFQFRVDHKIGNNDQLSARFLRETQAQPFGGGANFPGFDADYSAEFYNFLISETHVFSPTLTNEVRLSYNRIKYLFPIQDPSGLGGRTPNRTVTSISLPQVASNIPQGRTANNYVIQDTVSKVMGNHTFRGGVDYLRQISTQLAPNNQRGSLNYAASTGYTSFANFVDNFGGQNGAAARDFGEPVYFPSMHRIATFFQDRWKATSDLTLTLGLRYENFGTPFNTLRTPAYTGLFNVNPVTLAGPYSQPNQVQRDNNNFAPTVGVAYSPSFTNGFLGSFFGDKKSVIRAGYQIGYDSFFNNIASNAAASSPNVIQTTNTSLVTAANPRGFANFSNQFPTTAAALSPFSPQTLIAPDLVNPYYQRWSLGFQRELPFNLVMDASYVGSKGTKLYINEDANPLVAIPALRRPVPAGFTGTPQARLDPLQGARTVRTNGGSSSYHAGQVEVRRRFRNNFQVTGAYTFSKNLSNADEVFATGVGTASSVFALPAVFGGDPLEKGLSQNDRTHRAVFTYVFEVPFMREQRGFLGRLLGGYQLSGITSFESGTPYTVFNGFDSDGLGGGNERPTYNPQGQAGVRAVPVVDARQTITVNGQNVANPQFGAITHYVNPDAVTGFTAAGAPIFGNPTIDPLTARYIVNPAYIPGAPMSIPRFGNTPRSSERSAGINNWNLFVQKNTNITENTRLEFRAEFYNVFNHPQFDTVGTSNAGTGVAGRFLRTDTVGTTGGGRVIKYQIKYRF
ncbi:MAG TPA: TonB-dependent receptor [Pyrinomonadaceae bacterium]|jgi:outer membrane receptor protein involved in Fe transport